MPSSITNTAPSAFRAWALKRGLAEDLVIAPYASVMALMVDPEAACANLRRLATTAASDAYGFYEAIDYTPSRLPRGPEQRHRSILHGPPPGHGFLSLGLCAARSAHAAAIRIRSRVPRHRTAAAGARPQSRVRSIRIPPKSRATRERASATPAATCRVFTNPATAVPEVHLLSNGRYHVVVTAAGGGYSRWRDLAVTRWREDATRDCWGTFCYLRDVDNGEFWSAAYQPDAQATPSPTKPSSPRPAPNSAAAMATSKRTLEISVSPEDDIELRRITHHQPRRRTRTIELTSYAEVVLAAAGGRHRPSRLSAICSCKPKSFAQRQAILCTRRPRSAGEKPPWMFHLMTVHGDDSGDDLLRNRSRSNSSAAAAPSPIPAAMHRRAADRQRGIRPRSHRRHPQHRRRRTRTKPSAFDIVTGIAETREARDRA